MSVLVDFDLGGFKEFDNLVKKLGPIVSSKEVEKDIFIEAKKIRDDAKRRVKRKSGRLQKHIVAKKFKKKVRDNPGAWIGIKRPYGSTAPHAHLVEYGTAYASGTHRRATSKARTTEPGGYWTFKREDTGEFVRVKKIKQMPAFPFFRPALKAYQGVYINRQSQNLKKRIYETINKHGHVKFK